MEAEPSDHLACGEQTEELTANGIWTGAGGSHAQLCCECVVWSLDCAVDEVHIWMEYDAVWAGNMFTDVSEEPTAYLGSCWGRGKYCWDVGKNRTSYSWGLRSLVSCCMQPSQFFVLSRMTIFLYIRHSISLNLVSCLLLFYEPPLVQTDCRGDAIGPFSISASRVTARCLA